VARAPETLLTPQAEEAAEKRETETDRGELGDGVAWSFVESAPDERDHGDGGREEEAKTPRSPTQSHRNAVEQRPEIVEDVAGRPLGSSS